MRRFTCIVIAGAALAACTPKPHRTVIRPVSVHAHVLEPYLYITEVEEVRTDGELISARVVITLCRRDGTPPCVRTKPVDVESAVDLNNWVRQWQGITPPTVHQPRAPTGPAP